MDNDHILIIFDFSQLNVEVSVGQAEEVALPDVGVSLSYNARNSIVTNLNFFLGQKSEVVAI
jgi:hypothetical protein